ncbi:MAG: carbohydrate ABC transporter permease [Treponema sp.]|nr:carbohydrate ABC transporter permease [Treponema sp.]
MKRAVLTTRRVICYIVLILLTFLSLAPFLLLILNSTHLHSQLVKGFSLVPGPYFFRNLGNLLANDNIPILSGLWNSIIVSVFNALLSVYFSAMTAYGIHMYNFKGKSVVFKFIMAIMMIPTQVTALGFVKLVTGIHMINTLWPLILPAIAAPVVFFYVLQYMESVLPYSIVEASRVDGCNEFLTFNVIVLPMIKPALAVQAIFAFVSSWNNYFMPALIISSKAKKTIPILIAQLRSADFMKFDLAQVYIMICVAIIPLLVVYLFLSRYIIGGVTSGGVKE